MSYDISIISEAPRPLGSRFLDLEGSNGGQEIEEREWMIATMSAADCTEEMRGAFGCRGSPVGWGAGVMEIADYNFM